MNLKTTTFALAMTLGPLMSANAQDTQKRPDWESIKKRIEGAVERGDLTREQANQKYAEIKKKMMAAPARKDAPAAKRIDWENMKKRIEGAVERGELTREQANQKYAAIKKSMMVQPGKRDMPAKRMARPGPQGPEALKKLLGEMMKQDKIDAENAARIYRAAFGDRPPAPRQRPTDHAPHPGHMAGEMKKVLEAARRELAEIREIRMGLEQARRHQEVEMAQRHLMAERRELEKQREAMERERHEHAENAERTRAIRERAEDLRRQAMEREMDRRREAMERRKRDNDDREDRADRPRDRERPSPEADEKRKRERDREVD